MNAYELALLWDAWIDHKPECDHLLSECPVYFAAVKATVGVLDEQKAYTEEALRQQGEWSAGKALHCWEDGPPREEDYMGTTCMLSRGHEGPHEWTADNEIGVTFEEAK